MLGSGLWGGLSLWQCTCGLLPWEDTLLHVLLRMLLLLLLLLWRALCFARRRSDNSRHAMVAGMHCIISTAGHMDSSKAYTVSFIAIQ